MNIQKIIKDSNFTNPNVMISQIEQNDQQKNFKDSKSNQSKCHETSNSIKRIYKKIHKD